MSFLNNHEFKVGHVKTRSLDERDVRSMRHHTWVALAVGVAGVATSAYGANKQSKDNKAAAATNAGLQEDQNRSAWASYLMSRGVNPQGAQTGEIPTNPQAINARLPLWANASFSTGPKKWRKKGTYAPAGTLAKSPTFAGTAPVAVADPAASSGGGMFDRTGKQLSADLVTGNLLGIGGKDRSFFDPFGIF